MKTNQQNAEFLLQEYAFIHPEEIKWAKEKVRQDFGAYLEKRFPESIHIPGLRNHLAERVEYHMELTDLKCIPEKELAIYLFYQDKLVGATGANELAIIGAFRKGKFGEVYYATYMGTSDPTGRIYFKGIEILSEESEKVKIRTNMPKKATTIEETLALIRSK